MRTITQRELRNGSAAIMDAVEQGESFVVTRRGVAVAELSQGPHLAADDRSRAVRIERLQLVEANYHSPLPFDAQCARRYGSLVALVRAAGRNPRPRRVDLMIAATAVNHDLPLFTRNADDFAALESAVLVVRPRCHGRACESLSICRDVWRSAQSPPSIRATTASQASPRLSTQRRAACDH